MTTTTSAGLAHMNRGTRVPSSPLLVTATLTPWQAFWYRWRKRLKDAL